MKVGEQLNPKTMNVESINEEKQTAICVWIDEESGKICRCEIPLSALQGVPLKEN
jgi:hypothetical protein